MVPPAPGRLSMTMVWPSCSASLRPSMRAAISVPPLGAKPTITRIDLLGYACASAAGPHDINAARADWSACTMHFLLMLAAATRYRRCLLYTSDAADER